MLAFLIKDILLLVRNRSELVILLVMPLLLIAILSFSLRGVFSGDLEVLEMDIGFVVEDQEQEAIESVFEDIEQLNLPPADAVRMKQTAAAIRPQPLLMAAIQGTETSELISLERMERAQAEAQLEAGTLDAVISVPAGFTEAILSNALFGSESSSELQLMTADLSAPQSDVLVLLLEQFTSSLNFEAAFSRFSGQGEVLQAMGGVETITAQKPISSFQYYTVGMAVMFVLFVGSTIAAQANHEQRRMVFDRILLSHHPALFYLGSKVQSTVLIVMVQLALLFGGSTLLFDTFESRSFAFWSGIAAISFVLAIAVGCIAALMVSLSLRFKSDAVPAIFSSGIVSLMAFLGGSFIPMDGMPAALQSLGNWTPNGAALSAYFSWLLNPEAVLPYAPLLRIGAVALVILLGALMLYPKKGGQS